ncbi:hypothetical protein [Halobacillus litoralis]|nr:hypothetical protein [Halobacillus litoralis]
MNEKPLHYDGSAPLSQEVTAHEPFTLSDEARKNISGNPYSYVPLTEEE